MIHMPWAHSGKAKKKTPHPDLEAAQKTGRSRELEDLACYTIEGGAFD